jgi:hypothetical protein
MSNTTKEQIFLIAPEFKCTSSSLIEQVLLDVQGMIGSCYGKNQEIAQRYLAAHFLTLTSPEGEDSRTGIVQERLGDESVTYARPDKWSSYNSTKYGMIYSQLAKSTIPTAMFVTP